MSRSTKKAGGTHYAPFEVYTSARVPVTGLTGSDFTSLLSKDAASSAQSVTVTEIGSGRYVASFTDNGTGTWRLVVRPSSAAHFPAAWAETFDVTSGPLTGATIDGYTPEAILAFLGAWAAGKVTGGPAEPVVRSMNDAADRIAMTADASGNRPSVTLNAP